MHHGHYKNLLPFSDLGCGFFGVSCRDYHSLDFNISIAYNSPPVRKGNIAPMIYIIRAGHEGAFKVGYAIDPHKRLRQLQTANHQRLQLIKSVPGGRDFEAKIHRDLGVFRVSGEWFEATNEVLVYIANLGGADYEMDDGKPYLVLWRETARSRTDHCPFCGVKHSHGIPDGSRSPHCVTRDAIAVASDGTMLYQHHGYFIRTRNTDAESRVGKLKDEFDSIAQFFESHCERLGQMRIVGQSEHIHSNSYLTLNSDLYEAYKRFCYARFKQPLSHRRLTQYLLRRGFRQRNSGGRYWEGFRIR